MTHTIQQHKFLRFYILSRQGRRFYWNSQSNTTQWQVRLEHIVLPHADLSHILQRPSVPSSGRHASGGGRHASGRGWERPPVASEAQSSPVPPKTYSQAASKLPAQSSQYWFSIYALGKLSSILMAPPLSQPSRTADEMAFQKKHEGAEGMQSCV